jgi:sulfatase modifying factor 1
MDRPLSLSAALLALLAPVAAGVGCAAPAAARAPAGGPARLATEPATGMELLFVKGGCFRMGDVFGDGEEEEAPAHEVCVRDLYVGKFEVTQGQWRAVMGGNPSREPACRGNDDCPVDSVSWEEAQAFARRLSAGGARYRLPTEAEWEYAARSGGLPERYSGGDDVDRVAWYAENSGRRTHPVGTRAPNGLGLHDMSGNVWEWTADWYAADWYSRSPRVDPTGPAERAGPDVDHVIRGGCKTGEAANERTTRRSYGYQRTSSDRGDKLGFRLVRVP